MSSAIRYARNGDINIAYETVGSGPRDLVFIQGNITNLDIDWDDRRYREFCERRAEFSRLILFDKRGMGLSGRVETGTMEDRMNGGQGLVVIGVLYHDQPDPARAFAAQMQASAWPDGMKIESLWLALDCVKLRDAPEQGELTPHVASLAVKPAVWLPQTRVTPGAATQPYGRMRARPRKSRGAAVTSP